MLWFIQTDCKEGSHHIHESGGWDRTQSQPIGIITDCNDYLVTRYKLISKM